MVIMRELGKFFFNGRCLTLVIALGAGCSFKIKKMMYLRLGNNSTFQTKEHW